VCAAVPAFATRPVRIYDIDVRNAAAPGALQEAMRAALVRATGSREAANDPALANLLGNAQRYVQSTRSGPQGSSVVVFDGAAIERDIAAAGRTVWRRDRPFVLIALEPQPGGAAAETARRELEAEAESRGLPVSVVPVTALDPTGAELATPATLRAAQRLGADAVLVGQGDTASLNGQWRWSLYSDAVTQDWSGALDAGINIATDQLARADREQTSAGGEGVAMIRVDGIANLDDYAGATRALEGLPGVRRLQVQSVAPGTATWQITLRGGSQSLSRALSSSSVLQESGSDPALLVYHYKH